MAVCSMYWFEQHLYLTVFLVFLLSATTFLIQGAVYSNRCDPCLMVILVMPIKMLTIAR